MLYILKLKFFLLIDDKSLYFRNYKIKDSWIDISKKKNINLLKSENTYKEWENRTTATTKIKNKKTKNTNQSYGWLMM